MTSPGSRSLQAIHNACKTAYKLLTEISETTPKPPKSFINPTDELYEMIDRDIWRIGGSGIIDRHIGFRAKYESLTVSLFDDDDDVKAICVRRATDREGNPIKWKTYGSKRFIPCRIFNQESKVIFVGYGIAEMLLFELLEYNYMILQNDSVAHNLSSNPYTPKIEGRFIFALLDNDENCKATLEPLQKHYTTCKVYGIDFENVWNRELPKGYDFRDFCNEVAKEVRGDSFFADPKYLKRTITTYLTSEIQYLLGGRQ